VKSNLDRDFMYTKKRGMISCAAEIGNATVLAYLMRLESVEIEKKRIRTAKPHCTQSQRKGRVL
jgi:hypothetical protein